MAAARGQGFVFLPGDTLPEANSSPPEIGWLEYFLVSFWDPAYFQVRLLSVSGSVDEDRLRIKECEGKIGVHPLKTNVLKPENIDLEGDVPFQRGHVQVLCF